MYVTDGQDAIVEGSGPGGGGAKDGGSILWSGSTIIRIVHRVQCHVIHQLGL